MILVPTPNDNITTVRTKLQYLVKAMQEGHNAAFLTGLHLVPKDLRYLGNAEELARIGMSPTEREMYDRWKEIGYNGLAQEPNWERDVAPVPSGRRSMQRFTERAKAIDVVYGRDRRPGHRRSTAENAAWVTFHMVYAMPLVTAVQRVLRAQKHESVQRSAWGGISDEEIWEVITIRRIRSMITLRDRCENAEMRVCGRVVDQLLASKSARNNARRLNTGIRVDGGNNIAALPGPAVTADTAGDHGERKVGILDPLEAMIEQEMNETKKDRDNRREKAQSDALRVLAQLGIRVQRENASPNAMG